VSRSFPSAAGFSRTVATALLALPAFLCAQGSPNVRHLRVPLDSGAVHIDVTSRAATVTVVSPTGTFLRSFDTDAPLAAWANAAAALLPDSAASLTDGGNGSSASLTDIRLMRAGADSMPRYVLETTNTAWNGVLHVGPAQAATLFAVLRGDSAPGATPLSNALITHSGDGDKPDEFGTWVSAQLDQDAETRRGPHATQYPSALRGTGIAGTVRLWFIVDSTGHVRPSSVRLIGRAEPALAVAARDDLLRMRFEPAKRRGRPVAEILMQDFQYREQ
jgi:TonB family protein